MLPPPLRRLVVTLLLPCLIVDPGTAFAFRASGRPLVTQTAIFGSQAVNGALAFAPLQALVRIKDRLIRGAPVLRNTLQDSGASHSWRQKWIEMNDYLQDVVYRKGNVDHDLRFNPETDVVANIDVEPAFMAEHIIKLTKWLWKTIQVTIQKGGLIVTGGHEILPNVVKINKAVPKKDRIASQDLHPYGHVSLQSSFVGFENFHEDHGYYAVLTYDMVKNWSTDEARKGEYLHPHALFSVAQVQAYLKVRKYQVLWTNHAVMKLDPVDYGPGHITYASSFVEHIGDKVMKPFAVLTYETVKDWSERPEDRNWYLNPEASFTIGELKDYLRKRDTKAMVLAPDKVGFTITEEAKIHVLLARLGVEYVEVKGTDPTVDSYSAFFDNLLHATELAAYLKKRGKKRIFFVGNAFDYCVGWSATGAANAMNGFTSIVVGDATRAVGYPADQVQQTLLGFKQRGVQVITTEDFMRANEKVPSLLWKLAKRRLGLEKTKMEAEKPPFIPPRDKDNVWTSILSIERAYNNFKSGREQKRRAWDLAAPQPPPGSGYIASAGLENALSVIHERRFTPAYIESLRKLNRYSPEFLDYLANFKFTGDVWAEPEGRPVAPGMPLVRIMATPVEAALLQDILMGRIGSASGVATKVAHMVEAARGEFVDDATVEKLREQGFEVRKNRPLANFGLRRGHGKGSLLASWAAGIGGALTTSFVQAGFLFGMDLSGTMAHLHVMVFGGPDHEAEAFEAYAETFPDGTVILPDTYSTIRAVQDKVIPLALKMKEKGHDLVGIRLDSGNLVALSKEIRALLDAAGLQKVMIGASNDLDEYQITDILAKGAPIDFFGVGTHLITAPTIPLQLLPSNGETFWRVTEAGGERWRDVMVVSGEVPALAPDETAEALLEPYWHGGERTHPFEPPRPTKTDAVIAGSTRLENDLKGLSREVRQIREPERLAYEKVRGTAPDSLPPNIHPAPEPARQDHPFFPRDDRPTLEMDLYHLTMAQSHFNRKIHSAPATFNYTYRRSPYQDDKDPFVVAAGLRVFLEDLTRWQFTEEHIAYLRSLGRFSDDFLKYLRGYRFLGDIDAMRDGSVAFGHEPMMVVHGTIMEAAFIESFLLVHRNYANLVATRMHQLVRDSDVPIVMDGLRRAHGEAAFEAGEAGYIAGAGYTTSLDDHVKLGIPLWLPGMPGKRVGAEWVTGGIKRAFGGIYKLVEAMLPGTDFYSPAVKRSEEEGKASLPGRQVDWEIRNAEGHPIRRVIALAGERIPLRVGEKARRVLERVVTKGLLQVDTEPKLSATRDSRARQVAEYSLPGSPVKAELSEGLAALRESTLAKIEQESKPPAERGLRIAMFQLNITIGGFKKTVQKIRASAHEAKMNGARVAVFQEALMTGYPAQDLWRDKEFMRAQGRAIKEVEAMSALDDYKDMTFVIGAVKRMPNGEIRNVGLVIRNGKTIKTIHKHHLADDEVYNDNRIFSPGPSPEEVDNTFEVDGVKIGVAICEDIWRDRPDVIGALKKQGADDIIVLNGSHFYGGQVTVLQPDDDTFDPATDFEVPNRERDGTVVNVRFRLEGSKLQARQDLLQRSSAQHKVNLYYVNAVGGQDGIVFDGRSFVYHNGRRVAVGRQFLEDMILVEREKTEFMTEGEPIPKVIAMRDELLRGLQSLNPIEQVHEAIVLGIIDYLRKSGIHKKLVIGLSGGVDSAVVAAAAADAMDRLGLPRTNVIGIAMPSKISSRGSQDDARALAASLGITFETQSIRRLVWLATRLLVSLLDRLAAKDPTIGAERDRNVATAWENLQARLRMVILSFIANVTGGLLLSTGNDTEMRRGYSTIWGDLAGGYAPLKNVNKLRVYALGLEWNRRVEEGFKTGRIPPAIFTKPPSAELSEGQEDEKSLKYPYYMLVAFDQIYQESGGDITEVIRHRSRIDPFRRFKGEQGDQEFANLIYSSVRLLTQNEFKRQQSGPGPIITSKAVTVAWHRPVAVELYVDYADILQRVRDARLLGFVHEPREIRVASDYGPLRLTTERFADGEINVVNLDPEMTEDRQVTIRHGIDSADDVVEIILMIENMKQYKARRIDLEIESWRPETAQDYMLVRLLYTLCGPSGKLSLQETGGRFIEKSGLTPIGPKNTDKKTSPSFLVAGLQSRNDQMVRDIARENRVEGLTISVSPANGKPNHWVIASNALTPERDLVLINSAQTNEEIVHLLLTLMTFRDNGGKAHSATVINTHERYARQDQVHPEGSTLASVAALRVMDLLADRHDAINAHYADKIENNKFKGFDIRTHNAFGLLAKKMVDDRVAEGRLQANHPIFLVAPDDGAFAAVQEVVEPLKRYVREVHGLEIPVLAAYLDKDRLAPDWVERKNPGLLAGKNQPLVIPGGLSIRDALVLVLDDEIASGITLGSADYMLVEQLGFKWPNVWVAGVQGKFTQGLEPFDTGLTPESLPTADHPMPMTINRSYGQMPPFRVYTSDSLLMPAGFDPKHLVPLKPLISQIVRRIIGHGGTGASRLLLPTTPANHPSDDQPGEGVRHEKAWEDFASGLVGSAATIGLLLGISTARPILGDWPSFVAMIFVGAVGAMPTVAYFSRGIHVLLAFSVYEQQTGDSIGLWKGLTTAIAQTRQGHAALAPVEYTHPALNFIKNNLVRESILDEEARHLQPTQGEWKVRAKLVWPLIQAYGRIFTDGRSLHSESLNAKKGAGFGIALVALLGVVTGFSVYMDGPAAHAIVLPSAPTALTRYLITTSMQSFAFVLAVSIWLIVAAHEYRRLARRPEAAFPDNTRTLLTYEKDRLQRTYRPMGFAAAIKALLRPDPEGGLVFQRELARALLRPLDNTWAEFSRWLAVKKRQWLIIPVMIIIGLLAPTAVSSAHTVSGVDWMVIPLLSVFGFFAPWHMLRSSARHWIRHFWLRTLLALLMNGAALYYSLAQIIAPFTIIPLSLFERGHPAVAAHARSRAA